MTGDVYQDLEVEMGRPVAVVGEVADFGEFLALGDGLANRDAVERGLAEMAVEGVKS